MFKRLITACAVAALPCAPAGAGLQQTVPSASTSTQPEEPHYPKVTVGAVTFLQYGAELEDRDGRDAFDVTRGYINISGDVGPRVRVRITPDVKRVTDGGLAGSLTMRLKHAYVQFDDLIGHGSWVRFGLHQTPWLDFEQSIDRYRVQGTMMAEREGIIPGSADFGVGARVPFGEHVELNAGIYNGEGYAHGDANGSSSLQGRATVRPFPSSALARGLRLSAFYDLGWYDRGRPRRHGIVMASFEHRHVVATAQWLAATDRPVPLTDNVNRRGRSVFGEVRQGLTGWAGLVRVDRFDADRTVADAGSRRVIAGAAYWLTWSATRVGIVLTDEDVHYGRERVRPDENRLLAQVQVQF